MKIATFVVYTYYYHHGVFMPEAYSWDPERFHEWLRKEESKKLGRPPKPPSERKTPEANLEYVRNYSREVRARREAENLCLRCGLPRNSPHKTCIKCRDESRANYRHRKSRLRSSPEYQKEKRQKLKANGKCYNCGDPSQEGKTRCPSCLEAHKRRQRESYAKTKGEGRCVSCRKERDNPSLVTCSKCLDSARSRHRNQRLTVLEAYGHVCAHCGEHREDYLVVDHVHNDGSEHRKQVKGDMYAWLIKNGFPKDRFQLLCWSCNMVKQRLTLREPRLQ